MQPPGKHGGRKFGAKTTVRRPNVFRQKLATTLILSAACIAAAMLADYVVTVVVLRDYAGYTPFVTLFIATIVTLPVTYALVSSRANLLRARDELAAARDTAINA